MQAKLYLAVPIVLALAASVALAIPAFPGAEGYGAITPGGRGGTVYEVTTLADSGTGSFRAACQGSGARTVVFRVAGTIKLLSEVNILNPYITIVGQTAPGGGVCIAGETVSVDTHDVIIRHMRFRRGNNGRSDDALGSDSTTGNIIIDHCSASWGMDENLSIYRWKDAAGHVYPTQNVTIQYCISSEALDPSNHAFGGTWGGTMVSYHHNLFANNTGRNPSISWSHLIDYRNNVVYNWKRRTMDGAGEEAHVNVVNNYYKQGPATRDYVYAWDGPSGTVAGEGDHELLYRIVKPEIRGGTVGYGKAGWWYVNGNVIDYNSSLISAADANTCVAVNADNWDGGVQFEIPGMLDEWAKANDPFAVAPIYTQSAQDAYLTVLAEAGATRPGRDSVDARIIQSVTGGTTTWGQSHAGGRYDGTGGTGIINDPSNVGGWPTYASGTPPADADHDGLPNTWEIAHGLDPSVASNNGDYDADGFTNLEEYLNELAAWPAPKAIVWADAGGSTAGRYEVITNWDIPWQPALSDQVQINSGKATVGYKFQEAGTLYVGNTAASNGELAVSPGGQLTIANALYLGNASGARGTATLTGGTLTSGKAIVLASAASSTGLLKVSKGAYVQVGGLTINTGSGRSSQVGVEVASDGCSLIRTTATSTLGGGMDVQSLSGFRPREGDKFTVIASTDPSGVHFTGNFTSFTSNILLGLPGGSAFGGAASGSNYQLTFLGYTSGDANGNHKVDGGDLALMGGAWGQGSQAWATGDFTGDGVVDGGDLALLGGNWNWSLPGGAPELPLPEPGTLALLTLGAVKVITLRRRRR